jgi:hypothetical protein
MELRQADDQVIAVEGSSNETLHTIRGAHGAWVTGAHLCLCEPPA